MAARTTMFTVAAVPTVNHRNLRSPSLQPHEKRASLYVGGDMTRASNRNYSTPDALSSTILASTTVRPPINTYTSSLWWDEIISLLSFDHQLQEQYSQAIDELKEDVRNMLLHLDAKSGRFVVLIDTLERLGLGYHFETEIENKLQQISTTEQQEHDLLTTAIRFRLLRQHQHRVSSSVFKKFKDEDDQFIPSLCEDVPGLLSLYEASHVRIHGEDILDEALAFTTHHLTNVLPELQSPLKDKVKRALEQPLHKGAQIIEIYHYIKIYQQDDSMDNEPLLKLANLNFNFMQNLYKKEISKLSSWWKGFDLKTKLPYTRDRMMVGFLCAVGFNFEPQYSNDRIITAKVAQMVTTLDDIYDNYATLEEAQLLTDAIQKWDLNQIHDLPDYMKVLYQFIMSIYEDFVCDAAKRDKPFLVHYFVESVKQLLVAYNKEQKWIMERQMPSAEEYMENSIFTSGVYVFVITVSPGMKFITRESMDWLINGPKIAKSVAKLLRHINDMASHERESRDGELLTALDRFMIQNQSSKLETLSQFKLLIDDFWKDINEEWVEGKSCSTHKEIMEQLIHYSQMSEAFNKNNQDGFTSPEKALAPYMEALFRDSIDK